MASTIILSDNGASSGSAGVKTTGGNDGVLILQTTTSGGTATNAVYIDTSQNVGIGTSSPATKLQVVGSVSLETQPHSQLYFLNNTSVGSWKSELQFQNSGSLKWATGVDINAAGNNNFYWYDGAASAERMRIDSSGNLLVGTTSTQGKITAWTSTSQYAARFYVNAASTLAQGALCLDKYDNNSTTSQVFAQFTFNQQTGACGQINANGANQAAFGTFSDARLKQNIVDLPPQLSNIMALRPVEYDYIESEGGGHQIGFVAQEVQEIYPDLVGERSDGMLTLTDFNKNDARLIKAIQEQQAQITQLTERIAALENK